MVNVVHLRYIIHMTNQADHLRDAERLERQAEIADSPYAREALRRMAQTSRLTAAMVAMIEASGEELDRAGVSPVA
jgi:hypothetical protein